MDNSGFSKAMEPGRSVKFTDRAILVIIAFFFFALLPILPGVSTYHDDERFYTDAAIHMVRSGNYLTPYYPDGTPRFKKPILIYWVLAASYKIFGINYFSSRIPFLIAGCLVLWLTYKTSLMLFQNRQAALVSAIILFSNIQLFTSSVRSTPDILQCIFILMSLYGFMNLIFGESRAGRHYLLAYLGAALAVETKGLLGITPVLFSILFCFIRKNAGAKVRELLEPKSMFIAALVAIFWFATIYLEHGNISAQGFLTDQMGKRFSGSKMYILENILTYTLGLLRHFLPWSFLIFLVLIKKQNPAVRFFKEHKEECIFFFGWYLLLFIIFLGGNINRTRYLLPAYPLLSVFLGSVLTDAVGEGRLLPFIQKMFKWILIAGTGCGIVLSTLGGLIDFRIRIGGVCIVVISMLLFYIAFKKNRVSAIVALGLYTVVLLAFTDIFVRPVFKTSPAPQLARAILVNGKNVKKVMAIGLSEVYASQIRIFSGAEIEVQRFDENNDPTSIRQYPIIVLSEGYRGKWNLKGYTTTKCGHSYKKWNVHDFWDIIKTGDKDAVFSRLKVQYYLAQRT